MLRGNMALRHNRLESESGKMLAYACNVIEG